MVKYIIRALNSRHHTEFSAQTPQYQILLLFGSIRISRSHNVCLSILRNFCLRHSIFIISSKSLSSLSALFNLSHSSMSALSLSLLSLSSYSDLSLTKPEILCLVLLLPASLRIVCPQRSQQTLLQMRLRNMLMWTVTRPHSRDWLPRNTRMAVIRNSRERMWPISPSTNTFVLMKMRKGIICTHCEVHVSG